MIDPNLIYPTNDLTNVFPEEGSDEMTAQEILEGITRHRANPVNFNLTDIGVANDMGRKINEIEWALQALAEWLCDKEPEA